MLPRLAEVFVSPAPLHAARKQKSREGRMALRSASCYSVEAADEGNNDLLTALALAHTWHRDTAERLAAEARDGASEVYSSLRSAGWCKNSRHRPYC